MNLGLDLNLNVGLEQRLSPQMIQSLKLLQMNALELELTVKQELETNPLLEIGEEASDGDGESDEEGEEREGEETEPESKSEAEEGTGESEESTDALEPLEIAAPDSGEKKDEIDWESYLEEGFDSGDKRSEETENTEERYEKVPVYSLTLQDHLRNQLLDREVASDIAELVEYLIDSLDERGYLVADTVSEGIAPPLEPDPRHAQIQAILEGKLPLEQADTQVREAVHVLQSMDPPGIGARNLRECLLLQMRRSGGCSPLAQRIVEEDFTLLERLKIATLSRKYETTPEVVQAAVREIGALEPHPGRLLGSQAASPVTPDLIVEEVEGELVLLLNDKTLPRLRVSRAYANLLKKGSKARTDEKKFVRDKLNSATWLLRAIEQRKSTMLKVMQAILESQPDFFLHGPSHLRPLILQDVADKIAMHISTVSRVTSGKYVQTPHGIYELKYFFTAGVQQADGSEVSSVTAKEEIKKLIEAEDPKAPLSDQRIVEILKEAGLEVARRTVAKYRDQLEILPARLRKRY